MPDAHAALERQLNELENLYEIARYLLAPRDEHAIAVHTVRSVMGTFGATSAALLLSATRRRLALEYASGIETSAEHATLMLEPDAVDWLIEAKAFRVAHGRALGDARERLARDYEAVLAAPLHGPDGLVGLLLLGKHLLDIPYDENHVAMFESIAVLVELALSRHRGEVEDEPVRKPAKPSEKRRKHPALVSLIGESDALLEACDDLVAVAPTRFPVLLQGESGVGKELAARAIHDLSDRADGPMEVVDCGSIPRELIESELFGHVRGSFTGAHRDRRGAFEVANHGTLFLDEIGEMPLQLQTRLLRVLQEGRFRRVGDERPVEIDVRIVAATNRELKGEVAAGRFRQDLFYRLNVFAVRIPPLRDRHGDLPLLIRHFLSGGGEHWTIEPDALRALESHAWPGNIRELGTCARRSRCARAASAASPWKTWRTCGSGSTTNRLPGKRRFRPRAHASACGRCSRRARAAST
jgi:transcriptional regulator with GAF, ATPase, and Fis domain